MAATVSVKSSLKERIIQYEYVLVLLVFLLLRFIFKNILVYQKYFTEETIFNLSNNLSIIIGSAVLFFVCLHWSLVFGRLIKKNGADYEKPFLFLVAMFFACPATLPFLFDIKSASGTVLLYPFAVFTLMFYLANKPLIKWFIPFICAFYFIPSMYSSEVFYTVLRKGAILYVPLILLYLYLNMMRPHIESVKTQKKYIDFKSSASVLFIISSLASLSSYIFTFASGKSYYISAFNNEQKFNGYLALSLLVIAPALVAVCAVLYFAVKNKFAMRVFSVFWRAPIILFLLFRSNYYGLWIPFLLLSLFMLIFYSFWRMNAATLSAVRSFGNYCTEHIFVFYILIIAMASLSNVTSSYLSSTFQMIFDRLPF